MGLWCSCCTDECVFGGVVVLTCSGLVVELEILACSRFVVGLPMYWGCIY